MGTPGASGEGCWPTGKNEFDFQGEGCLAAGTWSFITVGFGLKILSAGDDYWFKLNSVCAPKIS
jgi:hypothetical protein